MYNQAEVVRTRTTNGDGGHSDQFWPGKMAGPGRAEGGEGSRGRGEAVQELT